MEPNMQTEGCFVSQHLTEYASSENGDPIQAVLRAELPLTEEQTRELGKKHGLDSLEFIEMSLGIEECTVCLHGVGKSLCPLAEKVIEIVN